MRDSGAFTFILSPGGHQYRSRFVAIQDMKRRGCPVEEVEGMRSKMVEHEGWRPSDLLPQGWLYKVIWEGFCEKKGSYSQNIHFLSREVQAFESLKKAITFISDKADYTKEDKDNLEEFRKTQMNPGKKYEWVEGGDSLPAGWKVRAGGAEGQVSMIMSTEGKAYRSRLYAVQDLLRRGESGEVVESLRRGMVAEEGWTANALLPPGWLFKVAWEGFLEGGRWSQNIKYFTLEGAVLESLKAVTEHLQVRPLSRLCNNPRPPQATPGYSPAHLATCRTFAEEQRRPGPGRGRRAWEEAPDCLPAGWRRRVGGGPEGEWILSPQGKAFPSRFLALQDMVGPLPPSLLPRRAAAGRPASWWRCAP